MISAAVEYGDDAERKEAEQDSSTIVAIYLEKRVVGEWTYEVATRSKLYPTKIDQRKNNEGGRYRLDTAD